MARKVTVAISNRHLHISKKDLDILFGNGYELTKLKDLSQPDQYAANEVVTIIGPKRKIEKVRILGPTRPETQVEVSITDCYTLGVKPMVRNSGDVNGTPGITIEGPKGKIDINEGVIVAARHVHLNVEQAKNLNVKDKEMINVQVNSDRPVVFNDVLVRVSDKFAMDMHIDTDEGNSGNIRNGMEAIIVD